MDIETLLAPIPGAVPTGVPAHATDLLLRLQDLRKEAREEAKGQTGGWKNIVRECMTALTTVGKDLRVASFLIEANVYCEGLTGLRDGLRLVHALATRYWDAVHPGAGNGSVDAELRAAPLGYVAGSQPVQLAIKNCPLIGVGGERFDWLAHDAARASSADPQLWDRWKAALDATPAPRRESMATVLAQCLAAVDELRTLCKDRLADHDVNWTPLADLLQNIRNAMWSEDGAAVEIPPNPPQPLDAAAKGRTVSVAAVLGGGAATAALQSRQDAFRELRRIAAFLRKTDPHSPIGYLLDRAVRWSEMPLDELYRDIVKKEDAREMIWETLGIKREGEAQPS